MIDHIGFPVADFARARAFYASALAPLGLAVVMEVTARETGAGDHAGFGATAGPGGGKPFFWIGSGGALAARGEGRLHVCFAAPDRAAVDAFYEAALAAGGRDNGPPGLRPHYHPNYYGAFVLDPDGHNIEAVCHVPPSVPA
ncbi:catechol 2,3-dioxygenase-like lactoylglutathione lyase family enzyme [Angulomicrobium tetraedrale]|uniref:Catechol 2,3-dioxygenase-like lactoylglutathione lyase family enzyme n=1 Tax=Ancylobacter tetraedralis TaxID=217068 RepID=A0A839Z8D9_9HYPH|nr:VOC family protein [Ancylobacter tetraedralis]MBB3770956.1 catechol 2,3-dioxygenase-like lactoylglutathione lyase family enzyme [Ancylobacter tetraedralis]